MAKVTLDIPFLGEEILNPSLDDISQALKSIDHEHTNPYIVLSRNYGFIQVYKLSPRRYQLEYREARDGPHRGVKLVGFRSAESAFHSFLKQDGQYPTMFNWEDITEEVDNSQSENLTAIALQLHVFARSIHTLNRGTVAMLHDAELMDSMTPSQRQQLQSLANKVVGAADRIGKFADCLMEKSPPNTKNSKRSKKKSRSRRR